MTRRGPDRRRTAAAVTLALATGILPAQETPPPTPPDPATTASTLLEQAQTAAHGDDPSRAADLYLELVAAEPEDMQWVIEASDNLLRAARFNDCLDLLDTAATRFPELPDIPIRIARTYKLKAESMVRHGARGLNVQFQLEEAARVASEVLRRAPWEREPRLILAQSQLQLGRPEAAMAEAEELVRRFPRDQAGHVLLGDAHFSEHSRYRLEASTAADPRAALALSQAARERAIEAYRSAATLDPQRPHPQVQLGRIFAWSGDRKPALQAFARALALAPDANVDHGWIHDHLTAAERADFYRVAAADYRSRADADPAAAATLDWYRAYACYENEDYVEAYRLFDAAVCANPAYLNSRCFAMLAAYWNRDHASAELQAALYAEQAPTHFADTVRARTDADQVIAILEFLARSSNEAGRLEHCRAISLVLARLLDTERHWNNYAFLCRETGAFEDSLQAYEMALSLAPNSPQLLNDTAVILHYHLPSEDNLQRAEELYQLAIARAGEVLADDRADAQARADARAARDDAGRNLAALRGK